jgi:predicted DCC family thiol-disulfide oxidoreductase YuxK
MNEGTPDLKKTPKLQLLYDGECPFCKREIAWMAQHNKKGQLAFEDITAPNFDPTLYGLTQEEVMGVIHGICEDGRIITKVEVFTEAYRLLGLGWLVAPLSWPLIRTVANFAYEIFARYRVPLGNLFGRTTCTSTRCKK